MRKWSYISLFILTLVGCQDVVEVDLPTVEEKLIFQALLKYNPDDPQENRISVSTTASFFGEIQPAMVEDIQIQNETAGGVGFYTSDPEIPGDYVPGTNEGGPFPPPQNLVSGPGDPEQNIVLTFRYLDELYLAFTNYTPVSDSLTVVQGDGSLIDEDETEIIISFTDPPDAENFYVFGFGEGEFVAIEDQFFDGQEYSFSYFSDQDLNPGDMLTVRMWGVDEQLYEYVLQLIEQSEMGENTIFQTPVTTVRGNILKVEDIDNIDLFNNVGRPQEFVLGYFAYFGERSSTLIIE